MRKKKAKTWHDMQEHYVAFVGTFVASTAGASVFAGAKGGEAVTAGAGVLTGATAAFTARRAARMYDSHGHHVKPKQVSNTRVFHCFCLETIFWLQLRYSKSCILQNSLMFLRITDGAGTWPTAGAARSSTVQNLQQTTVVDDYCISRFTSQHIPDCTRLALQSTLCI